MTNLIRKLTLATGIAVALAVPVSAAPFGPGEDSVTAKQRHEARDVQTGDYGSHGVLTKRQRDSMARQDRRPAKPNAPSQNITPVLHAPN
jgi:hypothetical protein